MIVQAMRIALDHRFDFVFARRRKAIIESNRGAAGNQRHFRNPLLYLIDEKGHPAPLASGVGGVPLALIVARNATGCRAYQGEDHPERVQ